MKKAVLVLVPALAGAMMVASCASRGTVSAGVSAPVRTAPVEVDAADEVTIDWKGRNVGLASPPAWVQAAAQNDPNDELKSLPRLNGKRPVVLSREGVNLPVVEAWVNTQAYAECAQKIRTAATTQAQNALEGDLQSAEAVNIANQFASLYSNATITGLAKEMDTWVKTRSKSKGTEKYTYYVLYAISDADLEDSIAKTFEKVEAKTARQQDLKEKLEKQMTQLMENAQF